MNTICGILRIIGYISSKGVKVGFLDLFLPTFAVSAE